MTWLTRDALEGSVGQGQSDAGTIDSNVGRSLLPLHLELSHQLWLMPMHRDVELLQHAEVRARRRSNMYISLGVDLDLTSETGIGASSKPTASSLPIC